MGGWNLKHRIFAIFCCGFGAGEYNDQENMNKLFQTIRFVLFAALYTFGLSSCTVITSGFCLDEIGQLSPKEHQAGEPRQVYQDPDYVYVQIPIVFIQNKQPIIRHLNMMDLWDNPIPYLYPNNKNPRASAPENYFLQIPLSRVKQGGVVAALAGSEGRRPDIRLLSQQEVQLSTCVRLPDEQVCCPRELLTTQRTRGNRLRRPLAWGCMVADIPLSVMATPIGWMVDIVSYPFAD